MDSASSSISFTAWSGPLPWTNALSEKLVTKPFPNKHTCGSIWFKRFHSLSDNDQLKMSMFFLMRSGFTLQGSTLVPLWRPHRRIIWKNILRKNWLLSDACRTMPNEKIDWKLHLTLIYASIILTFLDKQDFY